jgi:Na+-translocating ferredoxin:NAD+ oxidoreductase RnfE subunit
VQVPSPSPQVNLQGVCLQLAMDPRAERALTLGLPTLLDVIICFFPYVDTNCPYLVIWTI